MTNQASEDELTKIIDKVYLFGMNGGLGYEKFDNELSPNDAKAAIQALIRTEKLKLLAEVRERVVGEDYDIPAEMEKVGRDFQKLDAIAKTGGLLNKFKADLRTKLTKLEAEL